METQTTFAFPDPALRAARRAKSSGLKGKLPHDETLVEAQDDFRQGLFKGAALKCPCCGRKAKIYKRKLNAGMARMLVRFYEVHFRLPGDEWVHVHDLFGGFAQKHRDWPVLRLWGLIESKPERDEDGGATGYWKLTASGRSFVRGEGVAPKHVYMFNRQRVDASDDETTIREALGAKFNYGELMAPFNA